MQECFAKGVKRDRGGREDEDNQYESDENERKNCFIKMAGSQAESKNTVAIYSRKITFTATKLSE